jgi:exonuclease SbcD
MMGWLENADPGLPVILTAHASVQGASYGSERTVMLGADFVLPASLVKDPRLDYVALGHIHKPQDLNEGHHPPVIYPGSIERVDFGEARDDKFYVIVDVAKGKTQVEWKKLDGVRPFVDCRAVLGHALSKVEGSGENVTQALMSALPKSKRLEGAIVRLTVEYPREWDTLIDDAALRKHTESCFEFHLVKRPQVEARIRLPADQTVSSLSPLDLLDQYWRASHTEDAGELQKLAQEIIFRE